MLVILLYIIAFGTFMTFLFKVTATPPSEQEMQLYTTIVKDDELPGELQDEHWENRLKAVKGTLLELRYGRGGDKDSPPASIIQILLNVLEQEPDWHIRSEIIQGLGRYLCSELEVEWFVSSSLERKITRTWIHALQDPHPRVREEAVRALGTAKALCPVNHLLIMLTDNDEQVCASAATALQKSCSSVRKVIFSQREDNSRFEPKQTLSNPDVAQLTIPLTSLEQVIIDAGSCERIHVESFSKYMAERFHPNTLKRGVTIRLTGDPTLFVPETYRVWSHCRDVCIAVETIVFGQTNSSDEASPTVIHNPDMTDFIFPVSCLKTLLIDANTYNFGLLESFLTYAVTYLGQKYLRKQVTAHLYGDSEKLHPNLRNNLANLCRLLEVHEDDIWPVLDHTSQA